MKRIFFIILSCAFLISEDTVINNIELSGLVAYNAEQIFINSGLYPSEKFDDLNSNNLYDIGENFFDNDNDDEYDYGTIISRGDEFNSAIKNLWDLNVFSDIQISIISTHLDEKNNFELLDILIKVEEIPIVSEINIEGNKKIKNRTLLDLISIKKFRRISKDDIYNAKNEIKDEYIKKNYHNVDVKVELEDTDKNYSKNVKIFISEGKKMKIKEINFIGNNNFSKKEIIKNFEFLSEKKFFKFWKGSFNQKNLDLDLKKITTMYKNNGYRDIEIVSHKVEYDKKNIFITIELKEGEKNYYRNFNFDGNFQFSDAELLESLMPFQYSEKPLQKGDIYNEEFFNFSVYNLNKKYMDEGYYFIQIQTEVIPIKLNELDVNFKIIESEKTKIRKVIISGNNKTYDNVIRREMLIHPGDIFNMKKLEESYRQVFMLDYFESVDPQILTIGEMTEFVDLNFKVIEKETGRANFSMGYNELHGLTGGGGFDFTNFRGRGQYLSVSYNRGLQSQNQFNSQSISNNNNTDYQSFSVSFREPRIFDSRNSIGFSYSHSEQGRSANSLLKYDVISNRLSILFGRRFNWPDYFFRGSWTLNMRNTKYLGMISSLQDDFKSEDINKDNDIYGYALKTGVSITQIITRDSRNHPEFPTFGSKFIWTSIFSGDILGGHENYHKHIFDFVWYNELFPDKRVGKEVAIYQNFKFGALKELSEDQFIPYNARFVLGGSGTPYGEMLRGYPDNGIGPKRNSGFYSTYDGGKILFKYASELRFKISDSPAMYAFVFAEAGNIWTDFETIDIFDLKRSIGLGVRLNMPMLGTLGYDVGYGFDSIYDDPQHPRYNQEFGWEHHLLFGIPMN